MERVTPWFHVRFCVTCVSELPVWSKAVSTNHATLPSTSSPKYNKTTFGDEIPDFSRLWWLVTRVFPVVFLPTPGDPSTLSKGSGRVFGDYLLVIGASGNSWPDVRETVLLSCSEDNSFSTCSRILDGPTMLH